MPAKAFRKIIAGDFGVGPDGARVDLQTEMNLYRNGGKRVFDLLLVMASAPVWVPLVGVLALVVRAKLGAPAFFQQERPGHRGRFFRIIKFRTMTGARDAHGNLLPDAQRLTGLGRWMRSTSLDELPELFNVLRGEMSLVGPRPLLVKYLPLYSPEQSRRHDVLPGITGLAQVMGRNNITWENKFRFDVSYVDSLSWLLDVKILLHTVSKVLRREDVVEPYTGIHQEFTGQPATTMPSKSDHSGRPPDGSDR